MADRPSIPARIGSRGRSSLLWALGILGLIHLVDRNTPSYITLNAFYTLPVMIAAWGLGRPGALGMAALATGSWAYASFLVSGPWSSLVSFGWCLLTLFAGFLVPGVIVDLLRGRIESEREMRLSKERAEGDKARLQAQLQQSQKMESLGTLAGGVAHDMNNVLGAIMGMASTHGLRAEPGSALARDMETITRACQRGGILVRGLLGFARGGLAEELPVDLNAVVREVAALLERTTLQRVHLAMELAGDLNPVSGDPAALTHALMNLCVNALDAMPGGGTLALRTWNGPGGAPFLEVEDTGCGMPREVLDVALDPFFTTKPLGQGTGLGLSIVYATVKAHQGGLELHSEPGRGTRVRMTFPRLEADAEPAEPDPEAAPRSPCAPLHILLVDDDELVRESVVAVLDYLGHSSAVAAGGEEALERLRAGPRPDAVILDMNMPGLDGAGTLAGLRSLDASIPVILATGRLDQRALALAEAYPGVTLLAKPYKINALHELLAQADPRRESPVEPV